MGGSDSHSQSGTGSPGLNEKILFWASFLTLIAAGIGFSVRGAILKDWGSQFGFTQTELGTITGGGLGAFGLTIIVLSFFADRVGYGKLMLLAFLLHSSSAVVTFAATPVYAQYGKGGAFFCLNLGMWLFALGNGACEAVINPLTASLFPRNKTHWLNILHAGWPLGLILGAVITLGFGMSTTPIRWEFKLGVFLVPVILYGILMFNRYFPRSEASLSGISVPEMMTQVGFLGFAIVAALLGIMANDQLARFGAPPAVCWGVAGVIWVIYTVACGFSPGSVIIAVLYTLHALVGYVELGTDSWITNISNTVLKDEQTALLAFIWTNALMFTLRFFAGPIVEKINPIGLLCVSAILGTIGLALLGLPFTNTIPLWIAAVTIYGIGKTFYWPTLLGVISERFPKGGALALGISGGVGMLSAGMLGGPGIGYKQDYFAVEKIKEVSPATYERYVARDEKGAHEKSGKFPIVTDVMPNLAPAVAGLDNSKIKVFEDYKGFVAKNGPNGKGPATTLEADLETLNSEKAKGMPVEPNLEKALTARMEWWTKEGKPNFDKDKGPLEEAVTYGGKTALLATAAVPAVLAVSFLLLILYFSATGGYKQLHIGPGHQNVE